MSDAEYDVIRQISHNKNDFFRLLEIGAGNGNALSRVHYLYPNAAIWGIEKIPAVIQSGLRTVPLLYYDWECGDLPFIENFFDYIIYNNRADSIPPKEKIILTFSKYLTNGGKIFFTF